MTDLEAIKARLAAATPNWEAVGDVTIGNDNGPIGEMWLSHARDLVVHAPTDLAAEATELRGENERLRDVAEVERLRTRDVLTTAVVEAARDLIDCDPDTAQLDYLVELEDAVNAWRAGGDTDD